MLKTEKNTYIEHTPQSIHKAMTMLSPSIHPIPPTNGLSTCASFSSVSGQVMDVRPSVRNATKCQTAHHILLSLSFCKIYPTGNTAATAPPAPPQQSINENHCKSEETYLRNINKITPPLPFISPIVVR